MPYLSCERCGLSVLRRPLDPTTTTCPRCGSGATLGRAHRVTGVGAPLIGGRPPDPDGRRRNREGAA